MDWRLTPNEEDILLMAAKVTAKIYHRHRAEANKRYKPKPNNDGPDARSMLGLVSLSRRQREAGLTDLPQQPSQ